MTIASDAASPPVAADSITRTRLIWVLWSVAVVLVVVGGSATTLVGLESPVDLPFGVAFLLLGVGAATAGAVVAARVPGNAVGPILLALGLGLGLVLACGAYAEASQTTDLGPLPADRWAAWLGVWLNIPVIFGLTAFLLMLFPDGHLLSQRWRWAAYFTAVGVSLATVASALSPRRLGSGFDNPAGTAGMAADVVLALEEATNLLALPVLVLAALALARRLRRSRGIERQQIKVFTYVAAVAGLALGVSVLTEGVAADVAFLTALLTLASLPIVAGVAVLRHGLYNIDLVINKTLVFIVLAGFITAVYAGIVVGLGRLLPIGEGNLGLAIAATALVAVAFEPVRVRVQHWANRLVYGRRATPYEALAAMTARIGESADPEKVLTEAARLLADGTGASRAIVWIVHEGYLVPRGTAGDATGEPQPVRLLDSELPRLPGTDLAQAVRHDGELVGALSLRKRPGEGVSSADRRLVDELAGQAALLLANTRLRARLTDRLRELRASRTRMLAAQDRARHALERDLHDGAQQEVVAVKIRLGLAGTIATREGASDIASGLARSASVADQAVDTLRGVARGIYPPLLESEGLAAALTAQARGADLSVTVLDRAGGRYPRGVETTAYFCAVEALQNAVRHAHAEHAHIELDGTDSSLAVTVTDDGDGFDADSTVHGSGLTHMNDRADSAGGTLSVTSRSGHGTTIRLSLPVSAESTTVTARDPARAGVT